MTLLFIRLWPALVPIFMYMLWHRRRKQRHLTEGSPVPAFFDGPWISTCIAALGIATVILLFWGFTKPRNGSMVYTPAHMENGSLIKGAMRPAENSQK